MLDVTLTQKQRLSILTHIYYAKINLLSFSASAKELIMECIQCGVRSIDIVVEESAFISIFLICNAKVGENEYTKFIIKGLFPSYVK